MKKVLSFVLILALVLSSFSMAFAGSSTELKSLSDVAGNKNEDAIEVAYDLGIVTGNPDGTFQPEKAVTRAEFAAMITRALAIPQSALAGYANTSFKDTTGYTWAVPYLAFCNSKGIMLGDGAGNAMPGKTITVNEAVTMALRAIGYTANSSELVGVWPSNYVTKAQELELYDDVAKDATGVDKANAAQVIYNLLGVQKVAVNSDGETKKLWDVEPNANKNNPGVPTTLLSSGLNCKTAGNTVVTAADLDDSLINMAKYIGQYGAIYRNSDDEVVAFINDCDVLVGRFNDGGTKFYTTDEEKEYTVNATTTWAAYSVNGNLETAKADFQNDDRIAKHGKKASATTEFAISVDLTGKTIKDIYGINAWVVTSADEISTGDLGDIKEDQSLLTVDFALDDDDNIDYTKFNLVGVKSLSDIKADNVVYVYAIGDKTSNDIVKIEVGTQTAEGVVKNYKGAKDDVATKFAIGANTYKNASEVVNGAANGANNSTLEDGDVTDSVKAFLDARGYVYDFENLTKADNYAVVKRSDIGNGRIDDQVKLVLGDGTEKTFTVDVDEVGNLDQYAVIGYGLDSNGEITEANKHYVTTTSIKLGSSSVIKSVVLPTAAVQGAVFPSSSEAAFATGDVTNAKIASNCVVFTVDATGDYDVTTIDKVEVDEVITGAVLLFDEENNGAVKKDKVVAMIIPDSMAKSGDKSYAVLNEKNADSNDDADKVWHVIGYKDGAKLDALTDDRSAFSSTNYAAPDYTVGHGFDNVILYEVKTDAKGVVTDGTAVKAWAANQKVYALDGFTVSKADDRKSVTMQDASISGGFVAGDRFALSSKVVIYQVLTDDNEYKVFTGNLKAGDYVQLFETDDDADGYDVVIFARP